MGRKKKDKEWEERKGEGVQRKEKEKWWEERKGEGVQRKEKEKWWKKGEGLYKLEEKEMNNIKVLWKSFVKSRVLKM